MLNIWAARNWFVSPGLCGSLKQQCSSCPLFPFAMPTAELPLFSWSTDLFFLYYSHVVIHRLMKSVICFYFYWCKLWTMIVCPLSSLNSWILVSNCNLNCHSLFRWHPWSIQWSSKAFWIWRLSSWSQLSILRWLCWSRQTKFGDYMPSSCLQNQVPWELFSSKGQSWVCLNKQNIWILWWMQASI